MRAIGQLRLVLCIVAAPSGVPVMGNEWRCKCVEERLERDKRERTVAAWWCHGLGVGEHCSRARGEGEKKEKMKEKAGRTVIGERTLSCITNLKLEDRSCCRSRGNRGRERRKRKETK